MQQFKVTYTDSNGIQQEDIVRGENADVVRLSFLGSRGEWVQVHNVQLYTRIPVMGLDTGPTML